MRGGCGSTIAGGPTERWAYWSTRKSAELLANVLLADELIHFVVVKPRLPEVLTVELVVLVNFDDPLHERFEAAVVEVVDEALRVEVEMHQRIAPIDRQAMFHHRLEDFLRRVARERAVLEGDRELVVADEVALVAERRLPCCSASGRPSRPACTARAVRRTCCGFGTCGSCRRNCKSRFCWRALAPPRVEQR